MLQITAKDGGSPSRQTVAPLTVQITSTTAIGDKITFTQEEIKLDITEETASLNYQYDNIKDFVNNKNGKQIKYSIVTTQDIFDINENNGQISVNKMLDRETKSEYFFVVRAEHASKSEDSDLILV